MKRSDLLFWSVLILFAVLAWWLISTGKLDFLAGSSIDRMWNEVENLVKPIFRR